MTNILEKIIEEKKYSLDLIKKEKSLDVTIGMQMVFMPQYYDQLIPLAKLGKKLRPDYLVIKQCADDEYGSLGVDYDQYKQHYELLKQAEDL